MWGMHATLSSTGRLHGNRPSDIHTQVGTISLDNFTIHNGYQHRPVHMFWYDQLYDMFY